MISSTHNPKIQLARDLLAHARSRQQAQAFILEGVRLVEEAWSAGWKLHWALWSEGLSPRGLELMRAITAAGVVVEAVRPDILTAVSDTPAPQGLLALVEIAELPLPPAPHFLLLLDTLRDPGNLGTILRTASAAGAQGVILAPGCVDPFNPKVVRSAMGAHFHLPVLRPAWEAIPTLLPGCVYLADASGEVDYTQADFRQPFALVIGGEAEGASLGGQALATQRVRIPMPGRAESLNAAVAGAILMFEAVRQRMLSAS